VTFVLFAPVPTKQCSGSVNISSGSADPGIRAGSYLNIFVAIEKMLSNYSTIIVKKF
jgi:hypothetical protein